MIRIIVILLFVSATSASACLHCAWSAVGTAKLAVAGLHVPGLTLITDEKPKKLAKPKSAAQQYPIGYGTLHVDDKVWPQAKAAIAEEAVVNLVHADGNAYIAGITNTQFVPMDMFVENFVLGLEASEENSDVSLIERRVVEVNGVVMTELVIHATVSDMLFTYDVLMHSGTKGMIMLLSWSAREIYDELKADIHAAFSGLVVKK